MEIASPSLDGVESDSLRHHVLTTLATNVKWSLVTHLRTTHILALDDHEGFLLCEVALARDYL